MNQEILRLILSDCKIEEKNLCFSITKPFNELLKTPKIDKWCAILCEYRTENYEDFKQLTRGMSVLFNFVKFCACIRVKNMIFF